MQQSAPESCDQSRGRINWASIYRRALPQGIFLLIRQGRVLSAPLAQEIGQGRHLGKNGNDMEKDGKIPKTQLQAMEPIATEQVAKCVGLTRRIALMAHVYGKRHRYYTLLTLTREVLAPDAAYVVGRSTDAPRIQLQTSYRYYSIYYYSTIIILPFLLLVLFY